MNRLGPGTAGEASEDPPSQGEGGAVGKIAAPGSHKDDEGYIYILFLVHITVYTNIIHYLLRVYGSSKTSAIAATLRLFNLSNRLSAVS